MSAATSPATVPLFREGLSFWEELARECKRHADAINTAALDHGLADDHLVECAPGRDIGLIRQHLPSTEIKLSLSFEHWGPMINGTIKGHQEEDLRFYPEELEVPLAVDPDEGVVAILGEGKSLSPRELACYLAQNFRRCFPGISLPLPSSC
ncbi:MAG TPA: hypothetical protein VGL97_23365 [Bryobacteraceae bacterium]|jgi:hypothetical protein